MMTTIFSHLYRDPLYLREGNYIYPYNGRTCLATFRENPVDGGYAITQGFGGAYGFFYDPETGRVHVGGNSNGETIFRVNDSQTEVCHGIGGYDSHLTTNESDGIALAAAAIASMGDDRILTGQTAPRDAHELLGNYHPGLADSVDSGNPDFLGQDNSVDHMTRYNDRSASREWGNDPAENMVQGQSPLNMNETHSGAFNGPVSDDLEFIPPDAKDANVDGPPEGGGFGYKIVDGKKVVSDGRYFDSADMDDDVFFNTLFNDVDEQNRILKENAKMASNMANSEASTGTFFNVVAITSTIFLIGFAVLFVTMINLAANLILTILAGIATFVFIIITIGSWVNRFLWRKENARFS